MVQFVLFSEATEGSLPLATERDFGVILQIENATYPAQTFRSPINDEQWRQFDRKLRDCNINHDATMRRQAAAIRSLAHQLYESLAALSPALRDFLGRAGEPRRLVIQTARPELHLLPWAAMIDDSGAFLAAGDLSVVQSWGDFSTAEFTTGSTLRVMTFSGMDTSQVTTSSLADLPHEIEVVDGAQAWQAGKPVANIDILHLEEHGDAVTNAIGGVFATALANTFASVPIALLWSCCSGAANSWGESPALCLHRSGARFVLSFLAELHNLDAQSISTAFYREVFGPTASRDPETALVRIRAAKFANEFEFANWASMTLYMRAPLDLSALPLNGPRVPQEQWTADEAPALANSPPCDPSPRDASGSANADAPQPAATTSAAPGAAPAAGELWASLATAVSQLQHGIPNEFHGFEDLPLEATAKLPLSAFKAWRGNVIRLDGADHPLNDSVLRELNVNGDDSPNTDAAEQLMWFFSKIERYGSPLLVWTNAAPRHLQFLKNIRPASTLTFLLLYGPQPEPALIDLVDDHPEGAYKARETLAENCGDEMLSAAYFACVRNQDNENALRFIQRLSSQAEKWLLTANFISRRGKIPNPKPDWMLNHADGALTTLQQQHCQEDYFRAVITNPGTEAPERESGRAKHELGYLLQSLKKTGAAEILYEQALNDLEKCRVGQHDSRWQGAIGRLLRDWADLLSSSPDRLENARAYLNRAIAIHSFHGRRLQIAYCLNTSARICVTAGQFSKAIENAVDAANLFELLNNWNGWGEAMRILFDCLAEIRETVRMHSLADLAMDKVEASNLKEDKRHLLRRFFTYEKANANWIAGKLAEARSELGKLGMGAADGSKPELDPDFETEVRRLWNFLALTPQ